MTSDAQTRIGLVQGECLVTDDARVVYTTMLGSCIAVCMFDLVAKVGGMNHFLLPGTDGPGDDDMRYGVNSMELLINGLLKLGATRENLACKIFGGGEMRKSFGAIGVKNQEFTKKFLAEEGFQILAENLGGCQARKLEFWPSTGRVRHMLITNESVPEEVVPVVNIPTTEIELF